MKGLCHSMRAVALGSCAAIFLASATTGAVAQLASVTIGPPDDQIDEMLAAPTKWSVLHAEVGAVLFADHDLDHKDTTKLKQRFSEMASQHLAVELEVGAVKEWSHDGENTFRIEAPIWHKLVALGAHIVSVAMDEPLISARTHPRDADPTADAAEQTARFVAQVRQQFPDFLVGDIEPFPAVPLADHAPWLKRVNARLKALGLRPLDFYRIDPDWAAFPQMGNWTDVKTISDTVHDQGMRFSLIYWAATASRDRNQGRFTPLTWANGLGTEAAAVRASGVIPDQIVIESWIKLPDHSLPEDDRASFAGAAKSMIAEKKGP